MTRKSVFRYWRSFVPARIFGKTIRRPRKSLKRRNAYSPRSSNGRRRMESWRMHRFSWS